jgi:hypothetical protein
VWSYARQSARQVPFANEADNRSEKRNKPFACAHDGPISPRADASVLCAACGSNRNARSASITAGHRRAEIGERADIVRRTGVMRTEARAFRREAECDGEREPIERAHHPIESGVRDRPQPVGPAQSGAHMFERADPHPRRTDRLTRLGRGTSGATKRSPAFANSARCPTHHCSHTAILLKRQWPVSLRGVHLFRLCGGARSRVSQAPSAVSKPLDRPASCLSVTSRCCATRREDLLVAI